jgi:ubiquinone/menaquinone biosynthesis C-methylase UbiE
MLTHEQARAFYDRLGSRQDWQRFFENPAVADLIEHVACDAAESLFEFGCGTGRFAEMLLERHLPPTAHYLAVDISTTMVELARQRLARFGPRVEVRLNRGDTVLDMAANTCDRFLSTYVLDLLSTDDIRSLVMEARRALCAGGLLGLVSLTHGCTPGARLIEKLWVAVHSFRPSLVGGCRPVVLAEFVGRPHWRMRHRRQITRFGISSEVVVAEKVSA